jgi:hypothetical protein
MYSMYGVQLFFGNSYPAQVLGITEVLWYGLQSENKQQLLVRFERRQDTGFQQHEMVFNWYVYVEKMLNGTTMA